MTFVEDDRWGNFYLEFVDRAWWLIRARGVTNHRLSNPADYYRGENYDICFSRNKGKQTCKLTVWSRFAGEARPSVYEMGSEGGKGFVRPDKAVAIIEGMRRDMVLDELASI